MFPEYLTLHGCTWEVVYQPKRPKWALRGSIGTTHFAGRQIWVKYTGNIEADLETLAHEILHAFMQEVSISSDQEEYLVRAMERALYEFLRDNPTDVFKQRRILSEE